MSQQINEALLKLDTETKEHWTADGLPAVAALGINGLTRAEITAVAPHFTKENPTLELPDELEKETDDANEIKEETDEEASEEASEETDEEAEVAEVAEGLPPVISDPVVEQPTKEATDDLLAQKQAAIDKVAVTGKAVADAQAAHDKAQAEYDDVENKLEASQRGHTTQHDIMAFIKSQQKLREQKAAAHGKIMASGLNLDAMGPAPIDKAMSRKNGRGTSRPQRTV